MKIKMSDVKTNSLKAWVLAARPKTLTGAAVPVMMAVAIAWREAGNVDWIPAFLCLLFAFIMQIDANFVNDYFDWRRGNDDETTRLGPLRACSQGWITSRAMVYGIIVTTAVACAVGFPLVFYGGWGLILVGVACVAFCVLYTTTFSYLAMGDLLVLLFFGVVPVCVTYFILTRVLSESAVVASMACGLCIDNLLIVNNYRDIDNDRRDGKLTLIVFIGRRAAEVLYLALGLAASLMVVWTVDFDVLSLIMLIYFVLHVSAFRQLRTLKGRELNRVLGVTARNIFIFGLLASLLYLTASLPSTIM